ncbi:pyrimidine dimer DNA glycosylase [Stenotrophomonas phage Marzo]|nr:pyrimidine dimer DNA glycosylase [Stenotrophomonas phage Marzo]
MRMWMVDPKVLCTKHLLGEHVETHMFVGTINGKKSLAGYIKNGLVNTDQIRERHDALAAEMLSRGMNHNSPLAEYDEPAPVRSVDVDVSLEELWRRCPACAKRIADFL